MPKIDIILVPQGAEYQAVVRGINQAKSYEPLIVPIPMGVSALEKYLDKYLSSWLKSEKLLKNNPKTSQVVVLGLCGSLSPQYQCGDVVISNDCTYVKNNSVILKQFAHRDLNTWLEYQLRNQARVVSTLTSDRVICTQAEKSQLHQQTQSQVVDMEGFTILQQLNPQGMAVGIVRVVSDNSDIDLPEINSALSEDGALLTFPLIKSFVAQPKAAVSLIKGSWQALRVLQQVAFSLLHT